MKILLSSLLLVGMIVFIMHPAKSLQGNTQIIGPNDVIPNSITAEKIAETLFVTRFGKKVIEKQKPFKVTMKDSTVCIVEGTLPKGYRGGTAYIELRKRDCLVLKLWHSK
ncbi:NTF2 fold immunity protein of polymorphic toxin system component [Chitinophaga skermanii]|uniref:NTF2 fold immunity protein of polymorphic toxin system component n=1 Tax=Chitinophaga skermanii TaxID=331697 RepID=A0A327Q885_9BACT|nr:NTF2 fold immunity protein [Chitinophaga skermanii]RAJ00511.1 NTF2 fold immunity protein of polymorphic toxin system component [Chitinophaga skermanii]